MIAQPTTDPIETRAAQWILRRDRADFTAEHRVALERWLAEDARHREAYLKFDDAWRFSAQLKVFRPPDGHYSPNILEPSPPVSHRSRRGHFLSFFRVPLPRPVLTVAVVAVLAFAVTTGSWRLPGQRYVTAVGGYQRVLLEDGSVMHLNTNTQVRVQFTPEHREIHLDRGEAYFEVARNPSRPFAVDAADRRVVAVGTQFSIRKDPDDIRVSVTEGLVRLEAGGAELGAPKPDTPATQELLPAGTVAVARSRGLVRVARRPIADVEQQLSWRSGLLVFKNQPLADIVAELNRYNTRQLRIADPQLAATNISGNFKPNDLQSFITALGLLDIQATASGSGVDLHQP